ncbi:MAG: DUF4263 domain-containing protein [Bacteroidia bacterium]|nr:MAG: DUF4263 domain-containing protein [Bacteroidia bacterium]
MSKDTFDPSKMKPDHIYGHPINDKVGIVHSTMDGAECTEFGFNLTEKIHIKATYKRAKNDISRLELEKLNSKQASQKIVLDDISISKIAELLNFLLTADLGIIVDNKLKTDLTGNIIDNKLIKTLATIQDKDKIQSLLDAILEHSDLLDKDVLNIARRKKNLQYFHTMINEPSTKEEHWHKFFENNQWIFGYGLNYQFCHILYSKYPVGNRGLDKSGEVEGDFLVADDNFTVLVEIKTCHTKLFGKAKYRNECWELSSEVVNAVSQLLSQKHLLQKNYDDLTKNTQHGIKTCDPKAILIIGSWDEIEDCDINEQRIKKTTFELYRRNLRNVEIITFDELYKRAEYIVKHN